MMASTLVDRAKALSVNVVGLKVAAGDEDKAARFQTRAEQVKDLSLKIREISTSASSLRSAGVTVKIHSSETKNFVERLNKYSDQFDESPESIVDANETWRYAFINPLRDRCDIWRSKVAQVWQEHLDSTVNVSDDELITVFRQMEGFRDTANHIAELNRRAEPLYEKKLPDSSDIQMAEAISAEMKKAWDNLSSVGIPTNVRNFLINAAKGEATLDQLDDEVWNWLESNKVDSLVRIRFR